MTETLAYGFSSESTQRGLSNEYQHDRVGTVFKNLVASALEGLSMNEPINPYAAGELFGQYKMIQKT